MEPYGNTPEVWILDPTPKLSTLDSIFIDNLLLQSAIFKESSDWVDLLHVN